jgi:hypothetical protein
MEPTWPARRLAAAIAGRQLASRELLQTFLDRIERFNPALNAVVTLDAERAMRAASAADEAVAQGRALGPLHGLPVTIKDAIEVAGLRSTAGAVELSGHVPQTDAVAVSRLRAAGAIVFGKTNVPRWSSDIQTYNELFGTTSNPWDPARTPGGVVGGRCRRGRRRADELRARHRRRRLAAHPAAPLWRVRAEAELRGHPSAWVPIPRGRGNNGHRHQCFRADRA